MRAASADRHLADVARDRELRLAEGRQILVGSGDDERETGGDRGRCEVAGLQRPVLDVGAR